MTIPVLRPALRRFPIELRRFQEISTRAGNAGRALLWMAGVMVGGLGCQAERRELPLAVGESCESDEQCISSRCEPAIEAGQNVCCSISCPSGNPCSEDGKRCLTCTIDDCEGDECEAGPERCELLAIDGDTCNEDSECASAVCQEDVAGTLRCCAEDCLARGTECGRDGQCRFDDEPPFEGPEEPMPPLPTEEQPVDSNPGGSAGMSGTEPSGSSMVSSPSASTSSAGGTAGMSGGTAGVSGAPGGGEAGMSSGGTFGSEGGQGGSSAGSGGTLGASGSTGDGGAGGVSSGGAGGESNMTGGAAGVTGQGGQGGSGELPPLTGCDTQLLRNGDFEDGAAVWQLYSDWPYPNWEVYGIVRNDFAPLVAEGVQAEEGVRLLWLGGTPDDEYDHHFTSARQQVSIPAQATRVTLTGYFRVKTNPLDFEEDVSDIWMLRDQQEDEPLAHFLILHSGLANDNWEVFLNMVDGAEVAAIRGQTLTFEIQSQTDENVVTHFFYDSLELTAECD